jgi:hypothetical protein
VLYLIAGALWSSWEPGYGGSGLPAENVRPFQSIRRPISGLSAREAAKNPARMRADSKRRGQVMLYPWIMLGIEANRVVGLRVMKLMLGGKSSGAKLE